MDARIITGALAGLALFAAAAVPAAAANRPDPSDPNWPCVQRKVPELDPASVWSGPAIDPAAARWQDDPEIAPLVDYIAQRRVPFEEADAAVKDFASKAGAARSERLTLLFTGLFDRLNRERKDVMSGIDRFATKQRTMADKLKAENAALEAMRNDGKTAFEVLQAKLDEVTLANHIFDDRQKSLTFVCEVPVLIEQRLGHLGRTIEASMK